MRKRVECKSLYKTDYKKHRCKKPRRITAQDVDIDLFKRGGKQLNTSEYNNSWLGVRGSSSMSFKPTKATNVLVDLEFRKRTAYKDFCSSINKQKNKRRKSCKRIRPKTHRVNRWKKSVTKKDFIK